MGSYPEILVRPLHGEPFRIPVDKSIVTIGRSKRNDLVLADQWLSRYHAEVRVETGGFYVHDLDSRNGTLVNGERIARKVPIQNGDVITLGDQTLTFVQELSGSVIISESPSELDMEETVVVPTEQLLAASYGQEETWDNLQASNSAKSSKAANMERPERSDGSERRQPPEDPERIAKQNRILTALSQANRALISDRPIDELMDFILELAFRVVKAERGFLMLTTKDSFDVKAIRYDSDDSDCTEDITFSRSIAEKVITEKVSILTRNAMTDPRFHSHDSIVAVGIRSAMCAPLWDNKNVTGLIYVDSRIHENIFNKDDLSLLSSLANVAAIKIENAQLMKQKHEKERMEHELDQARKLQEELLPSRGPDLNGWDITGTNTPCYTVGGDYFDFLSRPGGKLAFALGDVSGKGAKAAMMMMVLRATVHSAAERQTDVSSIMSQTSRVLYHNSEEQSYATFFFGDLDPVSGELKYVNAGHIPPILCREPSSEVVRLETGGTVLGLFEETAFEVGETSLDPGDVLVVFTDGLSETWGENDEEFGEERLSALIKQHKALPAETLMEKLQEEVDQYSLGEHPTDDRTIVVVKRV